MPVIYTSVSLKDHSEFLPSFFYETDITNPNSDPKSSPSPSPNPNFHLKKETAYRHTGFIFYTIALFIQTINFPSPRAVGNGVRFVFFMVYQYNVWKSP